VHVMLEVLADMGKRYVCSDVFSGEAPAMLGFFWNVAALASRLGGYKYNCTL
jgi:hypothetical protein